MAKFALIALQLKPLALDFHPGVLEEGGEELFVTVNFLRRFIKILL